MKNIIFILVTIGNSLFANAVYGLDFNFTTSGLSNSASAALNRAGNAWSQSLSDPVSININVSFSSMGNTNVIGSASSTILSGGYTGIRNAMVNDASFEPDDNVVSFLPEFNQVGFFVPEGFTLSNNLLGTKANLKALGFQGLDNQFGELDGVINFNSDFAFDFDSSNGVNAGSMDFQTVAIHEIGHILGFVSIVDSIDTAVKNGDTAVVSPFLLDLFRFGLDDNPANVDEFATATRDITPGGVSFFDDLDNEVLFSTGEENGDGRQASHWKDNNITGDLVGIMDPTLQFAEINTISDFDLRSLDVIGYDVSTAVVPLPGGFWLFGSGLLMFSRYKRKQR